MKVLVVDDEVRNAELTALALGDAGHEVAFVHGGAAALSRFVEGMLFGLQALDPMTFIGVSGLLAAVALVASCVPARRAARVDPLVSIRGE